jgi:hypothetical protein
VKGSGIAITSGASDAQAMQMAAMRGQPMPDMASKVSVNESMEIELKGISEMDDVNLLDTVVRVLAEHTRGDDGGETGEGGSGAGCVFEESSAVGGEGRIHAEALSDLLI